MADLLKELNKPGINLLAELQQPQVEQPQESEFQLPPRGPLGIIPEVIGSVLSEPFAQVAGGLTGAVSSAFEGVEQGLQRQEAVQEALTLTPQTEIGQDIKGLIDTVGAKGVEVGNEVITVDSFSLITPM